MNLQCRIEKWLIKNIAYVDKDSQQNKVHCVFSPPLSANFFPVTFYLPFQAPVIVASGQPLNACSFKQKYSLQGDDVYHKSKVKLLK